MLFSNCKSGRIDHGMFKNSDFHDERQPESNMQPKPEIIIDIVEIRTETDVMNSTSPNFDTVN